MNDIDYLEQCGQHEPFAVRDEQERIKVFDAFTLSNAFERYRNGVGYQKPQIIPAEQQKAMMVWETAYKACYVPLTLPEIPYCRESISNFNLHWITDSEIAEIAQSSSVPRDIRRKAELVIDLRKRDLEREGPLSFAYRNAKEGMYEWMTKEETPRILREYYRRIQWYHDNGQDPITAMSDERDRYLLKVPEGSREIEAWLPLPLERYSCGIIAHNTERQELLGQQAVLECKDNARVINPLIGVIHVHDEWPAGDLRQLQHELKNGIAFCSLRDRDRISKWTKERTIKQLEKHEQRGIENLVLAGPHWFESFHPDNEEAAKRLLAKGEQNDQGYYSLPQHRLIAEQKLREHKEHPRSKEQKLQHLQQATSNLSKALDLHRKLREERWHRDF